MMGSSANTQPTASFLFSLILHLLVPFDALAATSCKGVTAATVGRGLNVGCT